jgi:hypothetical protein
MVSVSFGSMPLCSRSFPRSLSNIRISFSIVDGPRIAEVGTRSLLRIKQAREWDDSLLPDKEGAIVAA